MRNRKSNVRTGSAHARYIRLYRLMERRNRNLARGFNDIRRSIATQQLIQLRQMNLLTKTHLKSLTDTPQEGVRAFSGTRRE